MAYPKEPKDGLNLRSWSVLGQAESESECRGNLAWDGKCDSANGGKCGRFALGELWSFSSIMLDKHALFFTEAMSIMTEFKYLCGVQAHAHPTSPVPDNYKIMALQAMHRLKQAAILSDIDGLIRPIERMQESVRKDSKLPFTVVGQEMKHLISLDHLENEYFFHLDTRDVSLFIGPDVFGSQVAKRFNGIAEDIEESGKCLALQRPTACVFHLMRVMEHGVHVFAKKLKIKTVDLRIDSWYKISGEINKAIESLPAKTVAHKDKKQKLSAAAANLNAVRISCRNEVMHPKVTYTREQAHEVFNSTKAFMSHLASII